jgi:hypothetical protein
MKKTEPQHTNEELLALAHVMAKRFKGGLKTWTHNGSGQVAASAGITIDSERSFGLSLVGNNRIRVETLRRNNHYKSKVFNRCDFIYKDHETACKQIALNLGLWKKGKIDEDH